ncbi:MAG: hypothetical protein WB493_08150 [Anaeromyxobacteraceae bacterium]
MSGSTVVRCAAVEHGRVPERPVGSLPVERGERDEEVCEAGVLAAEKLGEAERGGESGVVHEDTFSREGIANLAMEIDRRPTGRSDNETRGLAAP